MFHSHMKCVLFVIQSVPEIKSVPTLIFFFLNYYLVTHIALWKSFHFDFNNSTKILVFSNVILLVRLVLKCLIEFGNPPPPHIISMSCTIKGMNAEHWLCLPIIYLWPCKCSRYEVSWKPDLRLPWPFLIPLTLVQLTHSHTPLLPMSVFVWDVKLTSILYGSF